jgi:hypothetical protein
MCLLVEQAPFKWRSKSAGNGEGIKGGGSNPHERSRSESPCSLEQKRPRRGVGSCFHFRRWTKQGKGLLMRRGKRRGSPQEMSDGAAATMVLQQPNGDAGGGGGGNRSCFAKCPKSAFIFNFINEPPAFHTKIAHFQCHIFATNLLTNFLTKLLCKQITFCHVGQSEVSRKLNWLAQTH